MAVDNSIRTADHLKNLEKPWQEHHDLPTTQTTIQAMLAGGTPDWVKHPEDYKAFARETYLAEKEKSDKMASEYHMDDQEALTNELARKINPMSTDQFIAKVRGAGIKCFTVYNGMKGTVGFWCIPPKVQQKARYICYIQIPAMYEWSVLALDKHNLPAGDKYRGWRTAVAEMIKKDILTEYKAHQIFGKPSNGPVFARYHRTLWEIRNMRQYEADKLALGDE